MPVLGNVGKVRKNAERAHNGNRVVARQPAQLRVEPPRGRRIILAAELQRRAPDVLDLRVQRLALVRAQHGAQQLPEQADVVAQRLIDGIHPIPARMMHEAE